MCIIIAEKAYYLFDLIPYYCKNYDFYLKAIEKDINIMKKTPTKFLTSEFYLKAIDKNVDIFLNNNYVLKI